MKKAFVTILGLAACLVACNKAEKVAPAALDPNRPVQFTVSNIYSLETKAPLDGTSAVEVFAGDPINASNVKLTVKTYDATAKTGTLNTSNSLLWGVGQTDGSTNFFAVYPHEGSRTITKPEDTAVESNWYLPYSISAASDVAYANDFLVAVASQKPGTSTETNKVALAFKHPFAKLVYNIDNTSDDYVVSATISGIRRSGNIGFTTGVVTATGDAIAAANAVALDVETAGTKFWTVVMPDASNVNPVVVLTMGSGAKYTFKLNGTGMPLEAGKEYTATIPVTGSSHEVPVSDRAVYGTFTVTDWTPVAIANESIISGGATEATNWWYIVGNIAKENETTDSNWGLHLPLQCVGEHQWEVKFYYAGTSDDSNGFKIKYAPVANPTSDWSAAYGKNATIAVADITAAGEGGLLVTELILTGVGDGIRIDTKGKYRVRFYDDTHNFHIFKLTD